MKKIVIYILLGILPYLFYAQEKKTSKADKAYETYAFISAIDSYEGLLKKGLSSREIYQRLGNSNYLNANYQDASKWYLKLLELDNDSISADYYFKYAQSLKSLSNYIESNKWMEVFAKKANKDDIRKTIFEKDKNYISTILNESGKYQIKQLSINSKGSDFGAAFYLDNLVFASTRNKSLTSKHIHEWNEKGFLDLFTIPLGDDDIKNVELLDKKINTKYHESTSVFSKDGKTIYFTRNNYKEGKYKRDKKGVIRLKIYSAKYVDDKWTDIKELPFNNDSYSIAHPALSADEKRLYFISDRPDSFGESDIYYVEIIGADAYGKPINLGNTINTKNRETFPFISNNGQLYFSSDGHLGLGGLDVFKVDLTKGTIPNAVTNVGAPINGIQDDFSFIIDDSTRKGYFTSNRKGGTGGDDIYGLEQLEFTQEEKDSISISLQDFNGIAMADTTVVLSDEDGNTIEEIKTNEEGEYTFTNVSSKKKYTVTVKNNDFTEVFTIDPSEDSNRKRILEIPKEAFKVGDDLKKILQISEIYFESNSSYITSINAGAKMARLMRMMQHFPNMKIEVRSHTDSKGTKEYNKWLSDRRAKRIRDYLVDYGIDANRIDGKGYGESKLLMNCTINRCSEKEHSLNRRSEFIVVSND